MSSSSRNQSLTTAKTVISTVGSFAATTMLIRAIIKHFLPYELNDALLSSVRNFLTRLLTRNITLVIQQYDGLVKNELYHSVLVYLHPKLNPNTRRLKITKPETESRFTLSMFSGEEFVDVFEGQKFKWISVCEKKEVKDSKNTKEIETRSFELTFHKKNEQLVLNSYLPHVTEKAQAMEQENRTVRIFTLDDFIRSFEIGSIWKSVTLDHPATFDTLAMDLDVKEMVKSDLDRFIARKEYYKKVGKAWKRGYLLYGPPGTGKSSLIAAIANYLKFDVYDLELTALKHNAELRRLLLGTANRSILVVEDIDCTIDALDNLGSRSIGSGIAASGNEFDPKKSKNKVTLSGLLNFVDGLWSSCGDERIIIFTTNNVEKLDPALLRPGRIDVHINMSYCTPCGFKLLASNYLEIEGHAVFEEIEGLIPNAKVTPAEVAEQLLKNDNPDVSLQGLVDFLHKKIKENEEAEAAAAAENLESEAAALKEIERLMPLANLTEAEIKEQSFKYGPDVSMRRIVGYMLKKIIDDKEAEVAAKKLKTEAAAGGAAAAAEKLEAEEDAT